MSMSDLSKTKASLPEVYRLYGSKGKFSVNGFLDVHYLQSHFTLGESNHAEGKLFNILRPAREIFGIDMTDMDSVLQRAVNDYRVGKEIIPYLRGDDVTLGPGAQDQLSKSVRPRFFPNIVAAIVPIEKDGREIENSYPKKSNPKDDWESEDREPMTAGWSKFTTYGGENAFCFGTKEISLGGSDKFLNCPVELLLSTEKCRLVILDGQHRAMALLALARNGAGEDTGWPTTATSFEHFYAGLKLEEDEDISDVQIPLTIAWFPDLHDSSDLVTEHSGSIKNACRALFTDINNNAMPMDETSKILLSDSKIADSIARNMFNIILNQKE
jgi:hypothetical protein